MWALRFIGVHFVAIKHLCNHFNKAKNEADTEGI